MKVLGYAFSYVPLPPDPGTSSCGLVWHGVPPSLENCEHGASFNGIDLSVLSFSHLDKLNLSPNETGRQRCDVPTSRASTGVQQLKEKHAERLLVFWKPLMGLLLLTLPMS